MDGVRAVVTEVRGARMHHLEAGAGRAVVLLHGNPTSSFLWRHVLRRAARTETGHRWIAPDLVGMGDSGPSASGYHLADHVAHVDGLIHALGLEEVVLVGHDWGAVIALDLLRHGHAEVRGLAVMEAHLRPLPDWDAMDEGGRSLFRRLRAPGVGERMVLDENFFIETLLPAALGGRVPQEELDAYRAPYPDRDSRRPLLQWAREVPVAGQPVEAASRLGAAAEHVATTDVPKLLVVGDPGVLVTRAVVDRCRREWSTLTVAEAGGPAGHFLPEDRPEPVADALLDWVGTL